MKTGIPTLKPWNPKTKDYVEFITPLASYTPTQHTHCECETCCFINCPSSTNATKGHNDTRSRQAAGARRGKEVASQLSHGDEQAQLCGDRACRLIVVHAPAGRGASKSHRPTQASLVFATTPDQISIVGDLIAKE